MPQYQQVLVSGSPLVLAISVNFLGKYLFLNDGGSIPQI